MYDNLRKLALNTGNLPDRLEHELLRAATAARGTLTNIPKAVERHNNIQKALIPNKPARIANTALLEGGFKPFWNDFWLRHARYGPYRPQ